MCLWFDNPQTRLQRKTSIFIHRQKDPSIRQGDTGQGTLKRQGDQSGAPSSFKAQTQWSNRSIMLNATAKDGAGRDVLVRDG